MSRKELEKAAKSIIYYSVEIYYVKYGERDCFLQSLIYAADVDSTLGSLESARKLKDFQSRPLARETNYKLISKNRGRRRSLVN